MSKVVCNTSSQSSTKGSPFASIVIDRFIVRRALEGRQIVVEWDITGPDRIRLLRKQYSFPNNIDDGVVVLDETPPVSNYFIDFNIEEEVNYYYRLFLYDAGMWIEYSTLKGSTFSCDTGFFQSKLFSLLPHLYRNEDKKTLQKIFTKAFIATLIEYHYLLNDGTKSQGELERFLRLFGLFLDEAKCFIDFMTVLWDVDNAPHQFLQYIASLVGVVFNFDLPIDRQRVEIREAVSTYKLKGTLQGITSHVQKITGFTTIVDEMTDNIMVTNRADRRTFLLNPLLHDRMGLCGDPYFYVVGQTSTSYGSDKILICPQIHPNKSLTDFVVRKLVRTLIDWIPADTVGIINFEDSNGIDVIDTPVGFEDFEEDVIEVKYFFTTDDVTHRTDNPSYVTYII